MTTHKEAEATIRRLKRYGFGAPVVAWWREHVQPAVPTLPDDLELVEDNDGVPVFRAVTKDDYGWIGYEEGLRLVGHARNPLPSDTFGGKRYIVRQVTPPAPSEVDRLARVLADCYWDKWGNGPVPDLAAYRVRAQHLYDHGVRCPDQTED